MTIHGVEYDVLFDGGHRGCDADLLCADPVPVKREHVPLSGWGAMREKRLEVDALVLACCQRQCCTRSMLIRMTQKSEWLVDAALGRLKEAGLIHVAGKMKQTAIGRWLTQYQAGGVRDRETR